MFAGPNGSGKSTLKAYLPTDLLGSYLNPDEIEQGVRDRGFLDVAQHGVVAWCCRLVLSPTDPRFFNFFGIPPCWRRPD